MIKKRESNVFTVRHTSTYGVYTYLVCPLSDLFVTGTAKKVMLNSQTDKSSTPKKGRVVKLIYVLLFFF